MNAHPVVQSAMTAIKVAITGYEGPLREFPNRIHVKQPENGKGKVEIVIVCPVALTFAQRTEAITELVKARLRVIQAATSKDDTRFLIQIPAEHLHVLAYHESTDAAGDPTLVAETTASKCWRTA